MILKWEAWSSILYKGTFYKFDAQWEVNIPEKEEKEEVIEEIENTEEKKEVVKKKVKSKK